MTTSEGPHLDLDALLAQLIERAQEVRVAQARLQGLFEAGQSIIGDLDLTTVLRRIVQAACDLVDARYGALGVIAPNGIGLEQFIHVGLDDATVDAIGHLPEGKGLLGALIEDPRPIRLGDIAEDARSVGFPASHPPMQGFLGVPVVVRGKVFGNLYLTQPEGGGFSAEDEQVVTALAATAGVAIENARLFAEAQERQRWLHASTEVTQRLLAGGSEDPLVLVASTLLSLAEADLVSVLVPSGDPERFAVAAAVGYNAEAVASRTYQRSGSLSEEAIRSGRPVLVADAVQASLARDVAENLSPLPDLGPVMALPLSGAGGDRGAVVVGRRRGSAMFTEALAGMASTFADHAAVALELAEARRDQARMTLLEDRARIARDLHDHVIQQLFAAGMTVQAVSPRLSDEYAVETLDKVVDHIDAAIKQIRTSIFQLRPNALAGSGLRTPVLEVVAEVTPALGLDPWVHFLGPVDAVSDEALAADVTAVVREALTNAAKHAQARRVEVRVRATTTELVVSVEDDGVGLGPTARRSGLENLRSRAARRNGTCEAEPGADAKGTRLVWTVPLGAS